MAKISLKIKKDNFLDMIHKLNELSNIDDIIKIKITKDHIFIYSLVTSSGDAAGTLLAMKFFNLKTIDYLDGVDDKEYHFIVVSANKFIKNLKIMNLEYDIKLDLNFREDENNLCQIRNCQFINNKIKLSYTGGENSKIKDISFNNIENKFRSDKAKAKFNINIEDFLSIKKLSSINSEEKVFNITIKDGIVSIYEMGKWEIEVDQIIATNNNLFFTKKYLSNINIEADKVEFLLFDTFIVISDNISSLICSFEQTFDDDDDE